MSLFTFAFSDDCSNLNGTYKCTYDNIKGVDKETRKITTKGSYIIELHNQTEHVYMLDGLLNTNSRIRGGYIISYQYRATCDQGKLILTIIDGESETTSTYEKISRDTMRITTDEPIEDVTCTK